METDDWLSLIAILLCLVVSAFFSASETSLTAVSRARLLRLEKAGDRRATVVSRLLEVRERMIGAILTGNNVVNIAATALTTGLLLSWFGEIGALYATAIMTVVVVVFTEVLPKTLAINAPERVALFVARPITWTVRLFGPVLIWVEGFVRFILRLFGFKFGTDQAFLSAHEELRGQVDLLHLEGSVEKQDRDMFGGLLDLRDLIVSDVMIHRTKMITACADDPPAEVVKEVLEVAGDARAAMERPAGEFHRHPACQGSVACAAGRRWRRLQDRRQGDRAPALVRSGHPPGVRAAQGVPPSQDAACARR